VFNDAQKDDKRVSMADMIVLGGCAAIEEALLASGIEVEVPFIPGCADASDDTTDAEAFDVLEPKSDAFRNFHGKCMKRSSAEEMMIDRSSLLGLTSPEMAVLVGGMRVLGINSCDDASLGVLTKNPGTLTNDFFVNLLDMHTTWKPTDADKQFFIGTDHQTGKEIWKASRADLIFGHHSELRAIAKYYACEDSKEMFAKDFVRAFAKVVNADRYDLPKPIAYISH
jgi:catalase-peroxidase